MNIKVTLESQEEIKKQEAQETAGEQATDNRWLEKNVQGFNEIIRKFETSPKKAIEETAKAVKNSAKREVVLFESKNKEGVARIEKVAEGIDIKDFKDSLDDLDREAMQAEKELENDLLKATEEWVDIDVSEFDEEMPKSKDSETKDIAENEIVSNLDKQEKKESFSSEVDRLIKLSGSIKIYQSNIAKLEEETNQEKASKDESMLVSFKNSYQELITRLSQMESAIAEEMKISEKELIIETEKEWREKKEEYKNKLFEAYEKVHSIGTRMEFYPVAYPQNDFGLQYLERLKDIADDEFEKLGRLLKNCKERFETIDDKWDQPYKKNDFPKIVEVAEGVYGFEKEFEFEKKAVEAGEEPWNSETEKLFRDGLQDFKEQLSELKGEEYYLEYLAKQKEYEAGLMANNEYSIDYEPFDPEERLRNATKLSPEDMVGKNQKQITSLKRERLEHYKKELASQKEGIAKMQLDLVEIVSKNNDFSLQDLMDEIYARGKELRLTKYQIGEFGEICRELVKKRDSVREARNIYKNDDDLYEACFGERPKGYIEVETHPTYLYFRCFNPDDFVGSQRSKEDKRYIAGKMTTGIRFLRGSILKENTMIVSQGIKTEEVRTHEEQHHIYNMIRQQPTEDGMTIEFFKDHIKDEFLAFYKGGRSVGDIEMILKEYSFRKQIEEQKDPQNQTRMKTIFTEGLQKAKKAIAELEEAGKSRNEIVAFLSTENFGNWLEVARRESKNIKSIERG